MLRTARAAEARARACAGGASEVGAGVRMSPYSAIRFPASALQPRIFWFHLWRRMERRVGQRSYRRRRESCAEFERPPTRVGTQTLRHSLRGVAGAAQRMAFSAGVARGCAENGVAHPQKTSQHSGFRSHRRSASFSTSRPCAPGTARARVRSPAQNDRSGKGPAPSARAGLARGAARASPGL